jgi:hypothetical protein
LAVADFYLMINKKFFISSIIFFLISLMAISQPRNGLYTGINNFLEFHCGYEWNVYNHLAANAQLNVMVGVLPVNLYSDQGQPLYALSRPLSQNGLRFRTGIQWHNKSLKKILSFQTEASYIYTYILRYEENPGQSGSNVQEFREQQRIGGLILTMTHRLGSSGRWAIFYSAGIRYKLINRHYFAEGYRQHLYYSNRTVKINRFEPVINFGVRIYFKRIEEVIIDTKRS